MRFTLFRRVGVRQLSSGAPEVTVFNSLRDELMPLHLRDPGKVTWYTCGPTVYDVAHLGHARTYVTLDILRRIFEDFLHLDVNFAMGMTDVDDKIITRARERGENPRELARRFEESFTRDMDDLGVQRPSSVGRVTEHIPQILAYIERIMANGLAYRAQDGVYFNTVALGEAYGRLAPSEAKGTGPLARVAGGDPHATAAVAGKLDARDFALWKLDISGESSDEAEALAWDSPWGSGRPGWHIECSAISAELCGGHLDLHSGGIDLKFPHHNNECAQCEAHSLDFGADKWSTAFVHTGHLYIADRKMSKSLKNFISVREFLSANDGLSGADDFRMFCLQNKYRASVHFSPTRITEARGIRRRFVDFLESARYLSVSPPPAAEEDGASSEASPSSSRLPDAEEAVRRALCNDFDTPAAIDALRALVSSTRPVMKRTRRAAKHARSAADEGEIARVADFVRQTLALFGLRQGVVASVHGDAGSSARSALSEIEFDLDGAGGGGGGGGEGVGSSTFGSSVDSMMRFRASLRAASVAIVGANPTASWRDSHVTHAPNALELSDDIRSRIEEATGCIVHDHPDGTSELRARIGRSAAEVSAAEVGAAEGVTVEEARRAVQVERVEQDILRAIRELPIDEAFPIYFAHAERERTFKAALREHAPLAAALGDRAPPPPTLDDDGESLFSAFDAKGIPTHDASGEKLSRSLVKRAKKRFAKFSKRHEREQQQHRGPRLER